MVCPRKSESSAQLDHVKSTFRGYCNEACLFINPEAQVNDVAVNRLETENIFRLSFFVSSSTSHKRNFLCGVYFRDTAIGKLRTGWEGFADSGSRGS